MVDVLVLGSTAVDHILLVEEFPRWDEVVPVNRFSLEPGGSGANVAYDLARLGVKVAFIGKVGGDSWADFCISSLRDAGVDVSSIVRESSLRTIHVYIIVVGGKKVVFVPISSEFALSLTSVDEVNFRLIDESRIVYLGEVFVEVCEEIARYSKMNDKLVLYRVTGPYSRLGFRKLKNIISKCNILLLNSRSWENLSRSGGGLSEIIGLGVEYVFITKGDRGVEIYSRDKRISIPSIPTEAIDTTGCGDAFVAGLIKKLLDGEDIENSARFGVKVASHVAREIGARRGLDNITL